MWLSLDAQAYNPTLPEDGWRAVVAPLGDVEAASIARCVILSLFLFGSLWLCHLCNGKEPH